MNLTTTTLAAGAMLAANTAASAALVGLHVEQHLVDVYNTGIPSTTWRLYAEFDNPTDQLTGVGGHILQGGIGFVAVNGGFYQCAFGGPMSSEINSALISFFPSLEADSWVTIGAEDMIGSQTLTTYGGVTWNLFENGNVNIWSNPLIAFWGKWVRPVNDSHAFGQVLPGYSNYHVLVGQFTTHGHGPSWEPWGRLSLNGQMEQILFNGGVELVPWEAHGVEFGTPHASAGACCFEDAAYGPGCAVLPEDQCDALAGNWFGPGTDCADPIVECDTYGACCHEDADGDLMCVELHEVDCDSVGGIWFGAATTCSDPTVECELAPQLGACCYELDDGTPVCVEVLEFECADLMASTWHGVGSHCADPSVNCVPETALGACCIEEGGPGSGYWYCVEVTQQICDDYLGVWHGVGSLCTDINCDPGGCQTADDSDCAGRPQFLNQDYQSFGSNRVAVQTVSPIMPGDRMVNVFDLADVAGASVDAIFPIDRYSDPSWRSETLGGILGLAIDEDGNIFVSASETWNVDAVGSAGSMGAVYRIDTFSGAVSTFAVLDVDNTSLGSITYDCVHDQFFVSNFNDGLIYRLDHASGSTLGTFDHGTSWNNLPGPVALGDRIFGLEVSGNRLYYAVWNEDINHQSTADRNEIWSVELSAAGIPLVGTEITEIEVSDFPGEVYSSPVADIDFGPNQRMYLAERTQNAVGTLQAHRARALEFECIAGVWTRTSNNYQVGEYGEVSDSEAGGIDAKHELVWASGDALHIAGGSGDYIYGFQGIPMGGGTTLDSYLIDNNDEYIQADKTQVGDLVVTRLPGPPPSAICPDPELLAANCLDAGHTPPFDFDLMFGVNNNDPAATLTSVTMTPPAGMSVTPSTVSMSVDPLHSWPFGTVLSGATSGGSLCIDFEYYFNNGVVCTNMLCIDLPFCEIWIRGDFDKNGVVNVDDLMMLIDWWGTTCEELDEDCNWIDADESGIVDMGDLLALLDNWTM